MTVQAIGASANVAGIPGGTTVQAPCLGQDQVTLDGADALLSALQQTPSVRADTVTQAQALSADAAYPPNEVFDGVSRLLGDNFKASQNTQIAG